MAEVGNSFLQASYLVCANSLRREAKLCDIILYVQGRMGAMVGYPAHKLLLISASKYFKLLFEREELRSYCHFPHLTEEGMFAVLDIIYGREIRQETNLDDALMAARFLQVDCAVEQLEKKKTLQVRESPPPTKRKRVPSNGKSPLRSPNMHLSKNIKSKEEDHDFADFDNSYHDVQDNEEFPHFTDISDYHNKQKMEIIEVEEKSIPVKQEPDVDLTIEESNQRVMSQPDISQVTLSFPSQSLGQGNRNSMTYGTDVPNMTSSSALPMNTLSSHMNANLIPGYAPSDEQMYAGHQYKFECEFCALQFSSPVLLQEHKALHTGEEVNLLENNTGFEKDGTIPGTSNGVPGKFLSCSICGKVCLANSLEKHMANHMKVRKYQCNICNKRFLGSTDLRRHMLTHTGEKPFCCDVCGKRFCLKGNRDQHMLTHKRSLSDQ